MKALEWQRFLQQQHAQHGKVVFTATELANASASSPPSLSVALQRLVARGVIERYTDGRYGLPGAATLEDLVPSIDSAAYVTGMAALHRHQFITQIPVETRCFTNRRHNRSRVRNTTLGRIVFVCVTGSVYSHPTDAVIAPPEQALCDFLYECRQRGVDPSGLVTFRNLDRLDVQRLQSRLRGYPKTVGREILRLCRLLVTVVTV